MLYATRCGHPLYYNDDEFACRLFWHDFDHGDMTGPSVDTDRYSDVRPATQADIESIRRGDSCDLCNVDTDPVPGR